MRHNRDGADMWVATYLEIRDLRPLVTVPGDSQDVFLVERGSLRKLVKILEPNIKINGEWRICQRTMRQDGVIVVLHDTGTARFVERFGAEMGPVFCKSKDVVGSTVLTWPTSAWGSEYESVRVSVCDVLWCTNVW
jgi:hypothetical protein